MYNSQGNQKEKIIECYSTCEQIFFRVSRDSDSDISARSKPFLDENQSD